MKIWAMFENHIKPTEVNQQIAILDFYPSAMTVSRHRLGISVFFMNRLSIL